jgi:hypothetical protein
VSQPVAIKSRDFWVKVVEMLQQNWALIDPEASGSARVFFVTDASGVFDEMEFPSVSAAEFALERNGFRRFAASADLQKFLRPPRAPFQRTTHPNGPIYSSGRFWRA